MKFLSGLLLGAILTAWVALGALQAGQAGERARVQAAITLGLQESLPGVGWDVVMRVPDTRHEQLVCSDPQVDRPERKVVCLTQVIGAWSPELVEGRREQ